MKSHQHQVLISHGIGNQLFQFAFALHLSIQQSCSVRVENSPIVSRLGGGKSEVFRIEPLLKGCPEIFFKKNLVIPNYTLLGRLLFRSGLSDTIKNNLIQSKKYELFLETRNTSFKFFPDIGRENQSTSFQGFWQNWQYAYPNSLLIYSHLTRMLDSSSALINLPKESRVLVCHVRRGDFLHRNRSSELGVIDLQSYIDKIKEIKSRNSKLQVITFTDSKTGLQDENNFEELGNIYGAGFDDYFKILRTMKQADYVISGNSTFSWWGAFLCMMNGGEVFLPKTFYKNLDTYGAFNYPGFNFYKNDFYTN